MKSSAVVCGVTCENSVRRIFFPHQFIGPWTWRLGHSCPCTFPCACVASAPQRALRCSSPALNVQPCPRLICHSRCIFAFILICTSTLDQPPIYPRRRSHLIDFVHYRWVAAHPPSFCYRAGLPSNTNTLPNTNTTQVPGRRYPLYFQWLSWSLKGRLLEINILIGAQGAVLDLKCFSLQAPLTLCLRRSCRAAGEKTQAFPFLVEEIKCLVLISRVFVLQKCRWMVCIV